MSTLHLSEGRFPRSFLQETVDFIAAHQESSGAIPWFRGGYLDPWDHVEAAMGLTIGGRYQQAEAAYRWLAENQRDNGGWWAQYTDGKGCGTHIQTNFSAYIATGIWHYYLITGKRRFLEEFWPVVKAAIDFVVAQQLPSGTISWAVDAAGKKESGALLTGCSSICKSIECGLAIAAQLDKQEPEWSQCREKLAEVICFHPGYFGNTAEDTSRFAMDWFYPVLAGVVTGNMAVQRLEHHWNEFVTPGIGCRCVSDQPWMAIAESCELVMALLAVGEKAKAAELYSLLHEARAKGGGYWTGYQFELGIPWPEEQTTWTAAAILLAADALTGHTPAAGLFLGFQGATEEMPVRNYVLG